MSDYGEYHSEDSVSWNQPDRTCQSFIDYYNLLRNKHHFSDGDSSTDSSDYYTDVDFLDYYQQLPSDESTSTDDSTDDEAVLVYMPELAKYYREHHLEPTIDNPAPVTASTPIVYHMEDLKHKPNNKRNRQL